jgi:acetylornithine aminotransferase
VPIGAVVAGPKAANIFQPGNHGTTFGGNPLAMRAGLETIRIMEKDGLLENADKLGKHFHTQLTAALGGLKGIKEIRGQGLMIGIELDRPCGVLLKQATDAGLIINVTADTVVRLLPPLIMTTAEADEVLSILVPLIKTFLAEAP